MSDTPAREVPVPVPRRPAPVIGPGPALSPSLRPAYIYVFNIKFQDSRGEWNGEATSRARRQQSRILRRYYFPTRLRQPSLSVLASEHANTRTFLRREMRRRRSDTFRRRCADALALLLTCPTRTRFLIDSEFRLGASFVYSLREIARHHHLGFSHDARPRVAFELAAPRYAEA